MCRYAAAFFGLFAACAAFGCSRGFVEVKPQTHKVEGKVTYKDGKAYTDGGAIEFRHTTTEGMSATGEIQPDGSFKLQTVTAQHKVPGAIEGTYQVTILPPAPDQNVRIISLQKKYDVVAGANQLTVFVDD